MDPSGMAMLGWSAVAPAAFAVIAVCAGVWTRRRSDNGTTGAQMTTGAATTTTQDGTDMPSEEHHTGPASAPRRPAIIVNPTKFDDLDSLRQRLIHICGRHGWAEPLWLETTVDDPGTGQAEQALAQGVDLVCPLGGDGTVRAVAAALVCTDVPLGLLPGGTGNLLARNLDLPIDSIEEALTLALTGADRRIDVGTVTVMAPGRVQENAKDHVFLIVAGIGFDAQVMAGAPENLKAQVGWAAYLVSGLRHLNGSRFGVDVSIDDDDPPLHRRVRTLMVGNVGKLQGGVVLMPDAQIDDGRLDVVMLAPKGIAGWAAVFARIVTKTRRGHQRVEHVQCRHIDLRLDHEQALQLDGDPIGPAVGLDFRVQPGALTVRVR